MFYGTGCCVYALFKEKRLVYIGLTTDMKIRMRVHVDSCSKDFDTIYYTERPSYQDMRELENNLIYKYKPKYNKSIPSGRYKYESEVVWSSYPVPETDRKSLPQRILELKTVIPQDLIVSSTNSEFNLTGTSARLYNMVYSISKSIGQPVILGNKDVSRFLNISCGTVTKIKNTLRSKGILSIDYTDHGLTVYTLI
jgi:hypothetical protein